MKFDKTKLTLSSPLSSPTVLVTGPGRCGSSTVARILHENIGICMGHYLRTGDEQNPKGSYEECRMNIKDFHFIFPDVLYLEQCSVPA